MRNRIRRSSVFIAVFALLAVLFGATPAQASTGDILPPFNPGETWNICQGYNNPSVSHTGSSTYGLDLTGAGCDNSASGRTVRAPMAGTVAYYEGPFGNLCINVSGGRSITLTHINSSITSGAVSAGQAVGTVAAPHDRNNNGVAHIHFQMWASSGCYSGTGIPFDSAHGARICGAPDLTASGPNGGNGTWSSTSFTGTSCNASLTSELLFYNADNGASQFYNLTASGSLGSQLGSNTWLSGWETVVPVELDGDVTSELLFYNADNGASQFYNLTASGSLGSQLGSNTWLSGWETVVPVELDGS